MKFKEIEKMGEKIKELRESKGMSQYRLAEITGINRSTINRYENGSIQKISFDNLLKICEALEVNIKEII
jgi:transcriptional regulator with XRE-family HTH domain